MSRISHCALSQRNTMDKAMEPKSLKYRHEWKYPINYCDMLALRQRLSAVAKRDMYAMNGKYEVRSLYFDTLTDKVLREKIDGVNIREKFRIRYYNGDLSFIRLEKKSKINGLCRKESAPLTIAQVQAILSGNRSLMAQSSVPLMAELYRKMTGQGLRPKAIVDYTREPFVFAAGNVRITLDYNLRTGMQYADFLNADSVTVPALDAPIILEIKWDEYLPDIIRDAVSLENRRVDAFSKYAACRIYG